MIITINIDKSTLNEIKNVYGNSNRYTVKTVLYDIFHRYFNQEYFDTKLSIEEYEDDSVGEFILNEIRNQFNEIFTSNGYNDSLFDENIFSKVINKENFSITEYSIGKIYALSEIYFKLTNEINCYGRLIELLSSYDLNRN
ncbi:MAG: hypothetical protein SFU27_03430 [Thermonemataceae bacterium]|nr:hypothetical protein [Thermonemataceae bacterium]